MKQIFFASAFVISCVVGGILLTSSAPSAPATTCVGGSDYIYSTTFPIWYTDLDTVAGATTDTFRMAAGCWPKSIKYSNTIYKCAGTPTVTVACYEQVDGTNYADAPITTYTVYPTSLTVPKVNTYLVNGTTGGNPNTGYMWVTTNTASSTISVKSSVLVRQ